MDPLSPSLFCSEALNPDVLDTLHPIPESSELLTPRLHDVYCPQGVSLDDLYGGDPKDNILLLEEQLIPQEVIIAAASLAAIARKPTERVCHISPRKRKAEEAAFVEDPECSPVKMKVHVCEAEHGSVQSFIV